MAEFKSLAKEALMSVVVFVALPATFEKKKKAAWWI